MGKPSRYWTWLRLYSNGTCKEREHGDAKTFFHQEFPQWANEATVDDKPVQTALYDLMVLPESPSNQSAKTCLRCFISHQMVQTCSALVAKYGSYYGFCLAEILPWVLDNEGLDKEWRSRTSVETLSSQILRTYRPHLGTLSTWTDQMVKQSDQLTQFWETMGVHLLSDWAILNDTKLEQLPKILIEFHLLTEFEVNQASIFLKSYHEVYRQDRIRQKAQSKANPDPKKKMSRRCAAPAESQLQRIGQLVFQRMEHSKQAFSPDEILAQLQELAHYLRQYRVHARRGAIPAESIDVPEIQSQVEHQLSDTQDEFEQQQMEFLEAYREEFLQCLDQAIAQVVSDRLQNSKTPEQGARFRKALRLFYCERLSMSAIAPEVSLRGQDNVTRLLQLKNFRADVRRHMLKHLLKYVMKEAPNYADPQRLQELDDLIESILGMLLDEFLQADAKATKSPKEYSSGSVFAEQLCQYLCQSDS